MNKVMQLVLAMRLTLRTRGVSNPRSPVVASPGFIIGSTTSRT